MDKVSLTDPDIPLKRRKSQFNEYLAEYEELDAQLLSSRIKVAPQVVTAFYELNLLSAEQVDELDAKHLDPAVLSLLLNLTPENRGLVLERLESFLKDDEPLTRITEFVNSGSGRMTIEEVVKKVDQRYWWALAEFLKKSDFSRGTINENFRNLLGWVARGRASREQLDWLDRGIRANFGNGYGIFEAPSLSKQFPKDVRVIQAFWAQNDGGEAASCLS